MNDETINWPEHLKSLEREVFEAWAISEGCSANDFAIWTTWDGPYVDKALQAMWQGWRAALKAHSGRVVEPAWRDHVILLSQRPK